MGSLFSFVISPTSAFIAAAVFIGVTVRVALLLHQRKSIWPR